jgi:ComF family protein
MVYNYLKSIQQAIYPATCQLCGNPGQDMDICTSCSNDLPHNSNCCHICALPLPSSHTQGQTCGRCLRQTPSFDQCHAPFIYGHPISRLISDFKFNGKLHAGRLLSELLINFIEQNNLELPDLILPVPLHPTRLKERGFNQALELARPISRHFAIPLDTKSCRRIKATATQSTLHQNVRRKNMRGAFEAKKDIDAKHLVIIDDVVTTGATVSELAKTVKSAGTIKVDVWALAKTP